MLEGNSGVYLLGQVRDLKREGLGIQGQPCRVERQPLLRTITLSTWGGTANVYQDCFLTWWVTEAWEGTLTARAFTGNGFASFLSFLGQGLGIDMRQSELPMPSPWINPALGFWELRAFGFRLLCGEGTGIFASELLQRKAVTKWCSLGKDWPGLGWGEGVLSTWQGGEVEEMPPVCYNVGRESGVPVPVSCSWKIYTTVLG